MFLERLPKLFLTPPLNIYMVVVKGKALQRGVQAKVRKTKLSYTRNTCTLHYKKIPSLLLLMQGGAAELVRINYERCLGNHEKIEEIAESREFRKEFTTLT